MRCNGSNWAVYSPGSWDGFRNNVWACWAGVIMRLEHHLVGGYVRYISPLIIIIIIIIKSTIGVHVFKTTTKNCNMFYNVCMFQKKLPHDVICLAFVVAMHGHFSYVICKPLLFGSVAPIFCSWSLPTRYECVFSHFYFTYRPKEVYGFWS